MTFRKQLVQKLALERSVEEHEKGNLSLVSAIKKAAVSDSERSSLSINGLLFNKIVARDMLSWSQRFER